MFECKTCNTGVSYSEAFVKSDWADGKPGNKCRFCNKKFTKTEDNVKERVSPALNTANCTPVSSNFTH